MQFFVRFARMTCVLGVGAALAALTACSRDPATRDDIFADQMNLPAVYLTAKTNKRIIAPTSLGIHVDKETGEIAWPALACNAPNCPGRGDNGEPFLFIAPDPSMIVKPDGTLGYDRAASAGKPGPTLGCPQCLKKRRLETETPEQRQQYINWVKPYVLPETAAAMKKIQQRRQDRIANSRRHE